MKKIATAAALCGALVACGPIAVPPGDNIAVCGAALFAAGTSNPTVLWRTAIATPACVALAADALQSLIGNVSAQQRARGVRG